MATAYFDCFAGAGGDMIVASLLNAGLDFAAFRDRLGSLGVGGYQLRTEQVTRKGLAGLRFVVELTEHEHVHRHLKDVLEIIHATDLPDRVKQRSSTIFTRLAEAEARVHNTSIEKVHFHEVGAIDSMVDIIGACLAMEMHGIDEVHVGAIPTGCGTVECAHGTMPVPAPATAELLRGALTVRTDTPSEMTTPTAAAIFTALASGYGAGPVMNVTHVGWGAGTREHGQLPNLLRVFIGQTDAPATADAVIELSANIDDCSGEVLGATIERLMEAGCLDAWASPIAMKKSRPAWMLCALCAPADVAEMERILFRETTTFGVRRRPAQRTMLARRHETVETPYGPVRVKVGSLAREVMTAQPEFADCSNAARSHHVSVAEVLEAARMAYRKERTDAGGRP